MPLNNIPIKNPGRYFEQFVKVIKWKDSRMIDDRLHDQCPDSKPQGAGAVQERRSADGVVAGDHAQGRLQARPEHKVSFQQKENRKV